MAMSRAEIVQQVQEVLVEALGVDEDEVTTEATLMGDLGAESIDFLDIVFRLEKAFGIKIPREELFPAEDLMNNSEFIHNGKLTEKGLAELREKMPHTDLTEFEKDPDINKMGDLFTVGAIVNYVDSKLKRLKREALNGIGVVFNIDDLGGGFYGEKAWLIFMRNLSPKNIIGCILKEGDTEQTLNGNQREFCIAIFGDMFDDELVRRVFESCSEKGLAPSARRFISEPESEPLALAGVIDSFGRLVQDEWSRLFHDRCKNCGWGFAPKKINVELSPELEAELKVLHERKIT